MQGAYDQKVQEIRDANNPGPPPAQNASTEEWQQWLSKSQQAEQSTNMQISLLGPSPTQALLNSIQSSTDFKKVKSEVKILPEIREKTN